MEFGQYEFDGRYTLFGVNTRRDTAAVILHGAGAVLIDHAADGIAVARQRFVYGVIDDFLHEVMKSPFIGRTDIHSGAFAYRVQTFQNLYLLLAVFALHFF